MTGDPGLPKGPDGLSEAVQQAIRQQRVFEKRRATRLGRGAERLTAPVSGLLGRMIPPALVRRALREADRAAGLTIPRELKTHDADDILACDRAALRVQAWAQGTSAASGGAAGWFGAAGLAVDVPATIGLAARCVRATGAAYGFLRDDEAERAYRMMVLEVATAMATERRAEAVEQMNALARELSRPEAQIVLEKGGRWVADKIVERIARQLGVSLAARKVGQIVPVMGGIVAATVNASFQADVARAARYAYRQRWLMERKALAGPDGDASDRDAG
ncbi:EcsC family protein [Psychromarinibacter sp. C21-152]|uniref:EcsC family protein n=1 Tax=Psychromarinibacter sediminicola TaxID=3033385 RepID=A0AAE3T737_9RHOB|nr:EcsC family protein [Psychromarinibacter sediminicola]MDF0599213.1 EcsC family protein [Psychromarinibacter sediminicola]